MIVLGEDNLIDYLHEEGKIMLILLGVASFIPVPVLRMMIAYLITVSLITVQTVYRRTKENQRLSKEGEEV